MLNRTSALVVIIKFLAILFSSSVNAWTIQESFDNQKLGQTCGNWESAGRSVVTNADSSSGPNACQLEIRTTDGPANDQGTGFGLWGGVISHPSVLRKGDEIWVRIRTFMPAEFDYNSYSTGSRLKFLRVHTKSKSNENHGYLDWYINPYPRIDDDMGFSTPFTYVYEGNNRMYRVGSDPQDSIKLGTWETYEFYISLDNISAKEGGNGKIRMWKDGRLLMGLNEQTLKTADTISEATYIFTYWNGGTPKDQQMYVDDVLITNEVPSGRDERGNPYHGMGNLKAGPLPPTLH